MAALYAHKKHGWQVLYTLYFPDGRHKKKFKHFRKKTAALLGLQEIEQLEVYSAKHTLTPDEIAYFLHRKYLTRDEAAGLTDNHIRPEAFIEATWDRLEDVYRKHVQSVGSPSTRKSYPYKIRPVIEHFRKLPPAGLTVALINEYISGRRKTVSKATVNKELSGLRTMLDYLVDLGVMKENPARKVKRFSDLPERLPRCFSPEELKKILLKANTHIACRGYFAELINAYLFTGMRRYELIHLKTSGIDFKKKMIRIRGKGDKDRIIDMHPALNGVFQSVIRKNRARKVPPGEYFFGGGRQPFMTEDSVGRAFRRFLQDSGISGNNSIHTLRHTFITYLLDSGVSIRRVQEIAGHSSMKTTFKYTHIVPTRDRTVGRLDYDRYLPLKSTKKVLKNKR